MDWIEVVLVLAFGGAAFYAGMHYGLAVKALIAKGLTMFRKAKGAV